MSQETTEQDFQKKADEYGKTAIANIREMIEAMEHAAECKGEMECPTCGGSGVNPDYLEQDETLCTCDNRSWVGAEHDTACELEGPRAKDCTTCDASGEVPCTEGKDSDDPEAWHDEERARERIQEDALSVEVRGDWHTPGEEDSDGGATEYNILLTTGGPEVYSDSADRAILLQYAQCFYFGD